jgi:hypothetical protein
MVIPSIGNDCRRHENRCTRDGTGLIMNPYDYRSPGIDLIEALKHILVVTGI